MSAIGLSGAAPAAPGTTPGGAGDAGPAGGAAPPAARPRWRADAVATLGLLPFATLVVLFLVVPTAIVVVGALTGPDGGFSLAGLAAFADPTVLAAFGRSAALAGSTALIGAVAGSLIAYVVARPGRSGAGRPGAGSALRQVVTSASGVLAQFGGVALAFAFIATLGVSGVVTLALARVGVDIFASGVWLFAMPGLVLVYTFFQVPLMVIVFLPALDGVRPTWREATTTLGGSTWQYWRHVGAPLLAPAFTSATLLLFANGMSAYATAAALVSQGSPIVPLQIRAALTSEVLLGRADLGKTLALGMVVVVVAVMLVQQRLAARSARWTR